MKKLFALLLLVTVLLAACENSEVAEDTFNEETFGQEVQEPVNEALEQPQKPEPEISEPIFHKHEQIEKLIHSYNLVCEEGYTIDPSMVNERVYDNSASIVIADVDIIVYSTKDSFSVDYRVETTDHSALQKLFIGFSKTLDPTLTKEQIMTAWQDLDAGKYTVYQPYQLGIVNCAYLKTDIHTGGHRYTIKTTAGVQL